MTLTFAIVLNFVHCMLLIEFVLTLIAFKELHIYLYTNRAFTGFG